MYGMLHGLALAVMAAIGDYWVLPWLSHRDRPVYEIWSSVTGPEVPKAWLSQDPADSVYRLARETLNRRDYRTAATLFAEIHAKFPKSVYAPDAFYWQAFA